MSSESDRCALYDWLFDMHDESLGDGLRLKPGVPESVIRRLADSDDNAAREAVAIYERTPADLLRSLLLDRDGHVLACLALNPAAPQDVLRSLALDETVGCSESHWARAYLVSNPSLPIELLFRMTHDSDSEVRKSALRAVEASGLVDRYQVEAEIPDVSAGLELVREWAESDNAMVAHCFHPSPWRVFLQYPRGLFCSLEHCDYGTLGEVSPDCDICGENTHDIGYDWRRGYSITEEFTMQEMVLEDEAGAAANHVSVAVMCCESCGNSPDIRRRLDQLAQLLATSIEGKKIELSLPTTSHTIRFP